MSRTSGQGRLYSTCGHDMWMMSMRIGNIVINKKRSKGQVFIILSIIIIMVMVMLKTGLNISQIMENKRYLESGFEQMQFQNIKNEALKTVQISYNKNITNNLDSFMRFARQITSSKAMDLTGIVVTASYNHSTAPYVVNVTMLNMLGTEISYLNITFNTSSAEFTRVTDGMIAQATFTGNYETMDHIMTLYYNTSTANSTDYVTIPFNTGKSKLTAFFDISLKSDRSEQRDVFNETYIL